MTAVGPVERVIAILEAAGYDLLEEPRRIGGIPFDFAAMLAGRSSLDLIVIVDLAVDAEDEPVRRRVESLARALDLVRSRRSLTVVLVGPRRGAGLIQAISGVARVLAVGRAGADDEQDLRDALAVLLPLEVATEAEETADSWPAVRERMLADYPLESERVVSAARFGKTAVENALRELLREPLDDLDQTHSQERDK
jgi:hypothetical protein